MNRAFALAIILFLPGLAGALPYPKGGVTAAEVQAALEAQGASVEADQDDQGDPMLRATVNDHPFEVYFYDLGPDHRAASLEFWYGLEMDEGPDPTVVEDWNRNYRFGRSYLDGVGDPILEMDLDVEVGFTSEALGNNLLRWFSLLDDFSSEMTSPSSPDPFDPSDDPESPEGDS